MNIKNEGLTSIQAEKRLKENGENVLLSGKKTSIAGMFFSQFKDLMILILAIATVISVAMGEGTEAIAIIIIVLLNAIMGFVQEYRTEKTLAALNALSAPHTHVLRDGKLCEIEAKNLVTDDVFFVSAGDRFPADGRVIEACELLCDEAIITGESEPVNKSVGGLIYMGSVAVSGNAYVLATATAMNTEMGKIAGMLSGAETAKTPLQQRLAELGRFVAVACVIVCLCVGFMGFLQGENFLQMLLTGVSLAVAAIPEGLPAIVTIVLALSVGRILKKGAIIRKLPAVETLGCAGVICSDKTGTITQSKMSVEALWVNGEGQINLYENGSIPQLNSQTKSILSRFWRGVCVCSATPVCPDPLVANCGSNPTETALLEAGEKNGFDKNTIIKDYTVLHEVPFNSVTKEMSVTAKYKGE
ncbi:MAG: HAD-IC family P-type ATPase, partial [Oscillospiraceae bacterium]